MIIAVDFDGTCVTHDFPKVGRDIGAASVLRELVAAGHQLILFTMRADRLVTNDTAETYLTDAINWFKCNEIPLYGVQTNPTQHNWTSSPKAYAQLYIDDAALGCPLIHGQYDRPFVDWVQVRELILNTK